MIVYKLTNSVNGKAYVGQTTRSMKERWCNHCSSSKLKHRSALKAAIDKYGKNSFSIEIIDTASSLNELNEKEIKWIKELNTISPNGYNLDGGGNNKNVHPATRKKLSLAQNGNRYKMSKIGCKNISEGKKGIKFTDEHKKSLSNARSDKKKVRCVETNEVFNSFHEAARILNLPLSNIARCANGERKTCHGLHFEVVYGAE